MAYDFFEDLQRRIYLEEMRKKDKEERAKRTTPIPYSSDSNRFGKNEAKFDDDDDIAPVRTTTKSKKDEEEDDGLLDIFQKGSFSDGFDWSDIPSAILGTTGDALLHTAKGVGGVVEGVTDLANYGRAFVHDKIGNDEKAEDLRERTQESYIDNLTKPWEEKLDNYSILGRTSEAAFQGLGQIGLTVVTGGVASGLGKAGATIATSGLMGLSSTGSGISEAYKGGANDLQALKHGMNSGSADFVSELMFGGLGKAINAVGFSKGLSSADDILAKLASSKAKNQVTKNLIEFGIKSGAEGVEEVVAGVAQAYSKYHNYLEEQGVDFVDVLKDENLLEQFVVGSMSSGMTQSGLLPGTKQGSLIESNKTGRDFISGLTDSEQKVIDKVVQDEIAQREKKGEKVSGKEKSKIYESVISDMDKGYISIDTIEEVLGGDTYATYKNRVDREDALQKEFDDLNNKKISDLTGVETTRKEDLRKMLENIKKKDDRTTLKSQLDNTIKSQLAGSRLQESYNERERAKQDYQIDYKSDIFKGTKHYDAAQKTIKSAIKAGANNTNRVHDIVDMAAKLSSDTGVVFNFKSYDDIKAEFIERQTKEIAKLEAITEPTAEQAEKLKSLKDHLTKVQSGEIRVNGVNTGKEIDISLDSVKALDRLVGHEVTHSLEKAKSYDALKKHILAYAKTKGMDIDSEIKSRSLTYEGVNKADPEGELVADLVGDFLFNDSEYIRNLATNDRNLFQRIYDEVKHLLSLATAGSKEARQLERVKHDFEKAYREVGAQKNTADSGSEYNINRTKTMSWGEQIQGALYNGKNIRRNDTLVVGNPVDTSVATAIENKPLAIPLSVLTKASSGKDVSHSIKKGKLAKLDEGIKNAPITIVNPERNAVVYVTDIKQGGLPLIAAFDMNATFDGDEVHKATSIHLQVDVESMLKNLPESATVYVQKNELDPVGATNTLRGLAAKIKFIDDNVAQEEGNVKYSLVEDQKTIDFLENQEHITVYKAMVLIDGKLYPPMASEEYVTEEYTTKKGEKKTKRVRKLKNPSVLGRWQKSDERPDLVTKMVPPSKQHPEGYGSFDLLKSNGKSVKDVAYNPYEHTSNIVLNDQFAEAYQRPELVTVEYHIPASELTSGYKAKYAKDSVGLTDWKAGGVAQKLKNSHRDVYLTRWSKPVRIVPDSEVAQKYKEILDKEDGISVPWNVVTPSLRTELEKIGVPIDYSDIKAGSTIRTFDAFMRGEYDKPTKKANKAKEIKYSLSDTNGRQLSEEQQNFFKDSVVRDENGTLKVMYHGTSSGGHTMFDPYGKARYGLFGAGSYFTDSKSVAEGYTKKGKGNNPQVYETYLNIKNPMDMDAQADPDAWANAFPDAMFPESGTNEDFYRAMEEYFEDEQYARWEAAEEAMMAIEDMGFDGITHIGGGRFNKADDTRHRVYIAFQPEQIKNVDNVNPTEDPDIRYSLSNADTDKSYLDAVNSGDTKTAQKLVDEAAKNAGYEYKGYHGSRNGGFTVFDDSKNDLGQKGFFFTSHQEVAKSYLRGSDAKMYSGYIRIASPLVVEGKRRNWNAINYELDESEVNKYEAVERKDGFWEIHNIEGRVSIRNQFAWDTKENAIKAYKNYPAAHPTSKTLKSTRDIVRYAYNSGKYDGVIIKNTIDMGNREAKRKISTLYIPFTPGQIKSADAVTYDDNGNVIPLSERFNQGNNDIRYSLSNAENDKNYLDAVNGGDMETARKIMEKVAKRRGYTIRAYHGTARGDRVGNVFLPERATSGPMAFFTDSKEIAENYAKSKQDTSLAYDPDYDRYETQFRIKVLDRDIPLYRAWGYLPFDARRRITQKAGQLRENWDGDNELILDPDTNEANGGFQWQLKEARGNAIQALTEQWLNSGNLFNEEARFLDVLEMAGVTEEFKKVKGMGELYFKDPNAKHEKVYDTFLRIRKPFDTATVDEQFIVDLESWYEEQDESKYVRENMQSDMWDKNGIDAYDFAERLRSDIENNTTHAWTSIPDSVTDYLKHLGYDGIKDSGGKFTGDSHTVWIPFYSSQIKSAETVTYDDAGNVIPITERFDRKEVDIRQSISHESQTSRALTNEDIAPIRRSEAFGSDFFKKTPPVEDIAPVATVSETENVAPATEESSVAQEEVAPVYETAGGQQSMFPEEPATSENTKTTRKALHAGIIERVKASFAEKGFDFDNVLRKAKNLSTFATVDNTPQRVMEKALGYKEGGVLADFTVNKVAQNETEGIKWLNSFTDRKNGLLAQISKQYQIKPGSKESAAAQMYAEGYYVLDTDKNGEYVKGKTQIVQYGDKELAIDFPDPVKQAQIKGLARDSRIRQIYDDTLKAINESRARNVYPEIPRLDNYFMHFRAMEDTFSRLGLPFNPNDIRAKDLPTDLNGVTADLKPGQPFFASAMHREGKRTTFDLLGGLEKYLTSAKNQIYHIDDIQNLRALRNYLAETYGQAKGLEELDLMTEEEAQQRIEEVYSSHMSTFAKFLNEEANMLAGKTALIDRGLEGIIGRRGMTFLDTLNRQVGANMVGYNVSSSLTNFLAPVQAFAKTNKFDFVKGFAQTVANRMDSLIGAGDNFAENSPVMIRRKGADRFHRTLWQKMSDPGYLLMSAVDSISTEVIARAKYNEFTRKGMDSQKAHFETDKWVSRLMGDRSLGQQPQLYNSKMLGIITKFQLEVRNQLDSQFYDTIQEAKVSTEEIQNQQARNAKTAAKVTSTFVQLAVAQHLFGKAFEAVAGYNPAFDIISAIVKAFGWDDDEESEDTALDNIEQGFFEFMEDMPYYSTFTGGRIPIESALPIEELVKGKDQYGNDKSRWETLGEAAPYYFMPGGYGQIKKTVAGMKMFSDDHPIAGSYTDSGKLRFPVEDTFANRAQAAIFGQWASDNARDYFDNDLAPLPEKQTQEFVDVGMSIQDYRKYRADIGKLGKLEEKIDYINGLNLTTAQKNILVNNLTDRKDPIDMSDYDEYSGLEEFDYANENPEKYAFFDEIGITYETYKSADKDTKKAYDWAFENPDKLPMSKAVARDVVKYRQFTSALNDIKADKDSSGKSISGSRKEKVLAYINGLNIDYGAKLILFKSEYTSDDDSNYEIVEYLNSRDDISYEEMVEILKELGITVRNGTAYWD